jgi:hypothetical protein
MCERPGSGRQLPDHDHDQSSNDKNGRKVLVGYRARFRVNQPIECRLRGTGEWQQVAEL